MNKVRKIKDGYSYYEGLENKEAEATYHDIYTYEQVMINGNNVLELRTWQAIDEWKEAMENCNNPDITEEKKIEYINILQDEANACDWSNPTSIRIIEEI